MISAILVVNSKGKTLVSRYYREDVRTSGQLVDIFRLNVVQVREVRSPVSSFDGMNFLHIKHKDVYIVAVTTRNANVACVFECLHALSEIFKGYFGTEYTADSIVSNFVLIYELLDEVLDYGYPQTTGVDILKMVIASNSKFNLFGGAGGADPNKFASQVTGAVAWRAPDLKYRKNELFIDVIESVNLLMSTKGTVLRADVAGKIMIKAYLSGMPDCKLGINDKMVMDKAATANPQAGGSKGGAADNKSSIAIDDCSFHQCVKLGKWDTDRSVTFIPPDGEFELMNYRITDNINLPFRILPNVKELSRTRIEAKVAVKANFPARFFASNVIISVPVPKNTASVAVDVTIGKAKYDAQESAILWRIKRFQGDQEYRFSAEVELLSAVTSDGKGWSRPPISMKFTVPMLTASNLKVRFLKVFEKSNYVPTKWVRYVTKAAVYEHRI